MATEQPLSHHKHGTKRARRFLLMMRNAVSSIPDNVFDESNTSNGREDDEEIDFNSLVDLNEVDGINASCSSDEDDHEMMLRNVKDASFVCNNIDDAMTGLHTLTMLQKEAMENIPLHNNDGDVESWHDIPSSCQHDDYDFILDGYSGWAAEIERTKQLERAMQESSQILKLHNEVSEEKYSNFATFGDETISAENTSDRSFHDDDKDDDFGEFVSADPDENDSQLEEQKGIDDDSAQQSLEREEDSSKTSQNHEKETFDIAEIIVSVDPDENDIRGRELENVVHFSLDKGEESKEKNGIHRNNATGEISTVSNIEVHSRNNLLTECGQEANKLFRLEDSSTPEGRFIRRRQLLTNTYLGKSGKDTNDKEKEWWHKSEEEMEEELSSEYYTDNYDGTLDVLFNVPWQYVKFWKLGTPWETDDSEEDSINVDETILVDNHITQKLSQLDASQAQMKKKLLRKIQENEEAVTKANSFIHEMDHNLSMAYLYVHRGKDAILSAMGSKNESTGFLGQETLLHDADQRDQLRQLKKALDRVAAILENEENLKLRISSFGMGPMMNDASFACAEYLQIIDMASQLRQDANADQDISRLACLEDMRGRVCNVMESFRNRIEEILALFIGRCCHDITVGFCSDHYEMLLKATLDVHSHQLQEAEEEKKFNRDDKDYVPRLILNPSETWHRTILSLLRYEADKCLARALLDPTNLSEEDVTESNYDKDLINLSYELSNGTGDNAKLRTLTHNLVTIRFDFESEINQFHLVYHKLCSLLTGVLHLHYMLVQWHKAPFDSRNRDIQHLHRKGTTNSHVIERDSKEVATQSSDGESESFTYTVSDTSFANSSLSGYGSLPTTDIHEETAGQLKEILKRLEDIKEPLWIHCESVLVKCLDQYLDFSPKKKLFVSDDSGKAWLDDLEMLHDILRLTCQFRLLRSDNDDMKDVVTSLMTDEEHSELYEKLCLLFRRHLRTVHVEAMNTMGNSLYNETWQLFSVEANTLDKTDTVQLKANSDKNYNNLKQCILQVVQSNAPDLDTKRRPWENQFENSKSFRKSDFLPNYVSLGNPFDTNSFIERNDSGKSSSLSSDTTNSSTISDTDSLNDSEDNTSDLELVDPKYVDDASSLYSMMQSFVIDQEEYVPPIATKSALHGLTKWIYRLLLIRQRIPLINEDVTQVITNIFDLYFTTALRLCAGKGLRERIILGLNPPTIAKKRRDTGSPELSGIRRQSSGAGIFSRSKVTKTNTRLQVPTVSNTIEADLCSPLPCEKKKTCALKDFICRGQNSLSNVVKLDKIEQWMTDPSLVSTATTPNEEIMSTMCSIFEKRQGAAWSCLFAAAILDVAFLHSERLRVNNSWENAFFQQENSSDPENKTYSLGSYAKSVIDVAPDLAMIASKISCSKAILGRNIVQEVLAVGDVWAEPRLNSESNPYIDVICDRCATIWRMLYSSPSKLPQSVLVRTWDHIVDRAYVSLLDGFSQVPYCSTEGRALMSIDLSMFSAGLSSESLLERLEEYFPIELPPPHSLQHGLQYVDTFVKVFYYPEEDAMDWINKNFKFYHCNHCLSLISGDENEQSVKKLYEIA